MKKILAFLLALATLFALTACTGDAPTPTVGESTPPSGENPTDGGGSGTEMNYEPSPPKYTRGEFVSRVEGYVSSRKPDRKFYYDDGFTEEENGVKETYYVKEFNEEHELNLFLHETNLAEGKQANGWIVVDKFTYNHGEQTTYTISVFYTIPCRTLTQAILYAKDDAYRVAPFYGLQPSKMKFHTTVNKERKDIQLTDETFEKIAAGEYSSAVGFPNVLLPCGDNCRIDVDIVPTANGQYEYVCSLRIQIYE